MGEASVEELRQMADVAVKTLARKIGASTFMLVVIGNDQVVKSSSSDLKPYERALVDELEKASTNRIIVWEKDNPRVLKKAEQGLVAKHAELHPIVAVLIESLNKLNNHKVSRSTALKDSSSTPSWWPHSPKKYAERTQQLNIKDLTLVIDAVLEQIRYNVARIEKLRAMLGPHFRTGNCSISTRAVFDAYFDFLLEEAHRTGHNGSGSLDGGNGLQTMDSLGLVKILPRPESTAQFLPPMLPSNLHRPVPIHQSVPEITKQGLRFKPAPQAGDKKRQLEASDLPAMSSEAAELGVSSDPTPEELVGSLTEDYSSRNVPDDSEYASTKRPRLNGSPGPLEWPMNAWYSAPVLQHVPTNPDPSFNPPANQIVAKQTVPELVPKTSWPEVWPHAVGGPEQPVARPPKTEDAALLKEQCAMRATEMVRQLAEADGAKGCMWMIVKGNSGRRFWCSSNLRWHSEAVLDEMEDAVENPLVVAPINGQLPSASDVLRHVSQSQVPDWSAPSDPTSTTSHADLAAIVRSLVKGMNRVMYCEGSPSTSIVPDWFPFPDKYREAMDSLTTAELLTVLDVMFQRVRGEYFHIKELKAQWQEARAELCSLRPRAAVGVYFDALEDEARAALVPRGRPVPLDGVQPMPLGCVG